jgi:hypothetical protein
MLYLYSKDIYGFEFCERFESESDLQKYCFRNLPKNDDYMIAGVVHPGEKDAWEADEDSTPNMQAIAACVEEAEKDGMQRPFWVICEGDCDYTAIQDEKDVDFYGLCKTWEDWGHFKIALCRYESGEISPEEAENKGMRALAQCLREDLGESDESDESDE